ncbi:MAG: CatB-related O-acetyltransferase [Pseudomonadota bacterium]
MAAEFPDPSTHHPLSLPDGTRFKALVFLKNMVTAPNFEVGAYTYASADQEPENWTSALAPYLNPGSADKLIIGTFCQIAHGVTFITSEANHRYDGFSTFPFAIFDGGIGTERPSLPQGGVDTVIGHDVWLGRGATVLPGARIGNGVVVGAGAVVGGQVAPYSIIVGNPGRVLRMRFEQAVIDRLQELAWWDWPIDVILANEVAICGADIASLEAAAP